MRNLDAIQTGLRLLRDSLGPLIENVLKQKYGDRWWQIGVLDELTKDGKPIQDRPLSGNAGDLDLQLALKLIQVYHWELFKDVMGWDGRQRTLLAAIIGARNQYEGHVTPNREAELSDVKTRDILEGMSAFAEYYDRKAANQIGLLADPVRQKIADLVPDEQSEEDMKELRRASQETKKKERTGQPPVLYGQGKVSQGRSSSKILWGDAFHDIQDQKHTRSDINESRKTIPKAEPFEVRRQSFVREEYVRDVPPRMAESGKRGPAIHSSGVKKTSRKSASQLERTPSINYKDVAEKSEKVPFIPEYTPRKLRHKPYEVTVHSWAGARGVRTLSIDTGKKPENRGRMKKNSASPPVRLIVEIVVLLLLGVLIGISLILMDRWLPGVLSR